MKRILSYIIMIAVMMCLAIVPAFATEADLDTAIEVIEITSETEEMPASSAEAKENATESEIEKASDASTETGSESYIETETETETEDIAAIIGGAESRLDAIVKLAGTMGITLEEAEALLDKMVAIGDEHFGESDLWVDVKASIAEDPEAWTVAALVVLMLMLLVIFIIRGLIKNTIAQSATKANITDIKMVLGINKDTGKSETLDGLKNDIWGLKKNAERVETELAEVNAKCEMTQKATDMALSKVEDILEKAIDMLDKVETIERNSANALKVNIEQALETVELLNIAMGRKMPSVSEATRKVWRDDAVSKIKAFASDENTETKGETKA